MDIDLKQIRDLMKAMKQLGVNELEIEAQDHRLYLRRGQNAVAMSPTTVVQTGHPTMPPQGAFAAPPAAAPAAPVEEKKEDENTVFITSPFVGTFYRAPSPDTPSFIEVGQVISAGTVLCIVEAMKLMNEIESEIGGTILEVMVENGKPVEFGDKLFKVKKSG